MSELREGGNQVIDLIAAHGYVALEGWKCHCYPRRAHQMRFGMPSVGILNEQKCLEIERSEGGVQLGVIEQVLQLGLRRGRPNCNFARHTGAFERPNMMQRDFGVARLVFCQFAPKINFDGATHELFDFAGLRPKM